MSQVVTLLNNAELAFAAYANLQQGSTSLAANLEALQQGGGGLSSRQAIDFASRFPNVLVQFNDTATSFSATVFSDTSNRVALAIRGTQEVGDFVPTDSNIALNGAGYDQIVALANWWRRVASPAGQTVQQFRIQGYVPNAPIPPGGLLLYSGLGIVYFLETDQSVVATGQLTNALASDPDNRVDVTGHSLGGHLSLAFNTLFPSASGQVTVFNSPGFSQSSTNHQFFSLLGGSVPVAGNSGNVTNVIADESTIGSTPWSGVAGLHSRPGVPINVPIENQWLSDEPNPAAPRNHSQMVLGDSLAVFGTLARLSPTLNVTQYKTILNQAVRGTAASYETIVDAVETLFGMNRTPLPAGNNNRDALYGAIYALEANTLFASSIGQLQIVPSGAADMLTKARQGDDEGLGYRYALRELNPFVVTGNATLYTPHNTGATSGTLELFVNASATPAGMTTEYLTDRAQMLAFFNQGNTNDTAAFASNQVNDQRLYLDLVKRPVAGSTEAKPTELNVFLTGGTANPRGPNTRVIGFGTDAPDALQGRENTDRLYGGRSSDLLQGGKANDYLEGGAGMDVYQYAADTKLFIQTNDGNDEIRDTDGKGVLRYTFQAGVLDSPQSRVIGGAAVAVTGTQWRSADGKFTYDRQGSDLLVTINGDAGGSVMIRGFDYAKAAGDGYLGIRLVDAPIDPQTQRTLSGDLAPDLAQPDGTLQYDTWGNVLTTADPATDRSDLLFGRDDAQGDLIQSGGGNDIVFGDTVDLGAPGPRSSLASSTTGGADWIDAGDGNDQIDAGPGDDLVEAGFGGDIGLGGSGNDRLYGTSRTALDSAIRNGETDQPSNLRGDLLGGGAGDDWIVGDLGNDLLFGGIDKDAIVGGAGEDTLIGGGGNDVLIGGIDNDTLRGEAGDDRYVFNAGDGLDTVTDTEGASDTISIAGAGVSLATVSARQAGAGDLEISYGSGDKIAVLKGMTSLGAIERFEIAGTTLTLREFLNRFVTQPVTLNGATVEGGASGGVTLYGGGGNDTIIAGNGNRVVGGQGNDRLIDDSATFEFETGDGQDLVLDAGGANVLRFGPGITASDIGLQKETLVGPDSLGAEYMRLTYHSGQGNGEDLPPPPDWTRVRGATSAWSSATSSSTARAR